MKTKLMTMLLLGAGFLAAAPRVSIGFGIGIGPRYYGPSPVYAAPAPPLPYAAPAPVYAPPAYGYVDSAYGYAEPAYAPPAPGPGYAWVQGYWLGYGRHRNWHAGYWVRRHDGFRYRR
ncbi:MAG: hypothetical protein KGN84_19160 [Acidobacteriota bacterium]|nr:hypothetical protein [Acidobacteriota bacterium]